MEVIVQSQRTVKALLRAFGDRPLIRTVRIMEDGNPAVPLADRSNPVPWIGWPKEDVFEFNEMVYDALVKLSDSENREKLKQKWRDAKRLP